MDVVQSLADHQANLDALQQILDGKSVLISGATGVVGLHIVFVLSHLVERGAQIKATLVSKTGSTVPFRVPETFESLILDFSDQVALTKFESQAETFDFVVHAAGYGQPNKFMSDPFKVIALNSIGTNAMARIARRSNGRFLFLSTSEIYTGVPGKPSELSSGASLPQHFRAPYIEAKRIGETITEVYRNEGLSACSARLALAYGPGVRLDDGRVLNQFIVRALTEETLVLMDQGVAERCYVFAVDAAIALLNILTRGEHSVYNIGGETVITIRGLAEMIGDITDTGVEVPVKEIGVGVQASPSNVSLDVSRYTSEFGDLERTSIRDGLERTVGWYRGLLAASTE